MCMHHLLILRLYYGIFHAMVEGRKRSVAENFNNHWPKKEYPLGESKVMVTSLQREVLDILQGDGARRSQIKNVVIQVHRDEAKDLTPHIDSKVTNVLAGIRGILNTQNWALVETRIPLEGLPDTIKKLRREHTETHYRAVKADSMPPKKPSIPEPTTKPKVPTQREIMAARRRAAAQEEANLRKKMI